MYLHFSIDMYVTFAFLCTEGPILASVIQKYSTVHVFLCTFQIACISSDRYSIGLLEGPSQAKNVNQSCKTSPPRAALTVILHILSVSYSCSCNPLVNDRHRYDNRASERKERKNQRKKKK